MHNFNYNPSAPNFEMPWVWVFDWRHYYYQARRKLWVILLIASIVCLGTWGCLMRQPKIYSSRAVLQVDQVEQKLLKADDIKSERLDSAEYINTVAQALINTSLMARVIEKMELSKDIKFAPPKPDGSLYSPIELVEKLKNKIKAVVRRGTRLIDVIAEDEDPKRAQLLAQNMVKEFFLQNFEQRHSLSNVANEFLRMEAEKLKEKLESSERRLQEYKEKYQAASLEEKQNITLDKLRELNQQLTYAKAQRVRLESDLELVRKIPANNIEAMLQIPSVSVIPQVVQIREQLVNSENELSAIQKRYLHKHPQYVATVTQIANLKEALREILKQSLSILDTQYKSAIDTEEKFIQILEQQEKAALALNKIAIPYNVLNRDVESHRIMYDAIVNRLRETTVAAGLEKNPFRVIEVPMMSKIPSKPRKLRTMMMALVFGIALGFGIVLGLDYLDSSIRSVDQAEELLALPSLAAVPDLKLGSPFVMLEDNYSPQAEAFRTLRTSLSLLGEEAKRRIILFTSAIPAEGKSYTSSNAAIALAQQGLNTLLIDADLRRSDLSNFFESNHVNPKSFEQKAPGLTNYLSDLNSLEDIIQITGIKNLSLVSSGQRAPNPAELFARGKFIKLLEEASLKFERIVIDTAPINAVSDTLLFAAHVHTVCLVVRANKTPIQAIQRANYLLKNSRAHVAGIVLNRLPKGSGAGYYYYSYGDKYYFYGDNKPVKNFGEPVKI